MRYAIAICFVVAAAALFAGCAKEPPMQPVQITADSYCQIAQKVTWSVDDTRRTITEVRRENAKIDSKCQNRAKDPAS
jgi:uncharacterized lipoprotein YajG